ncbi:hypothetical protein PLEOSDRAFT_1087654 [Pleurotus ostreatus PC15]|uniref:Uncharacterized protein n=1 Tax=Pleurotus ostreatus (strain PC15) TaxID=1137138 RepID=A0A067NYR8_PLEO1|nr:hypothetical protein PLEOSDRAFT_1087654 [Pleurotus ostreatus PC15]
MSCVTTPSATETHLVTLTSQSVSNSPSVTTLPDSTSTTIFTTCALTGTASDSSAPGPTCLVTRTVTSTAVIPGESDLSESSEDALNLSRRWRGYDSGSVHRRCSYYIDIILYPFRDFVHFATCFRPSNTSAADYSTTDTTDFNIHLDATT